MRALHRKYYTTSCQLELGWKYAENAELRPKTLVRHYKPEPTEAGFIQRRSQPMG